MVASSNSQLQSMLQRAVQTVQWTYCLFWKLCPRQRILVWSDGYYNGAIKTRKTVQPMEVSAEEESLQRSQQLRELYDALSAGETNQQARRPSAALCPGDLTESEWFYLMCVSFSFPPGVGLPGRAYAKRQHVWLTGANEVDSKFFTRAILAKSASVQTVVCIPLLDGVVELGTVERVEEDVGFIRQIKSIFNISNIDQQHEEAHLQVPMPALSEHSTSNNNPLPANSSTSGAILQQRRNAYTSSSPINTNTINTTAVPAHQNQDHPHTDIEEDQDLELEEDEDNDEDDDDDDDDHEADSDADINNNNNCSVSVSVRSENPYSNVPEVEPRELMQLDDMSEDIRVGSPDDGSNNLDSSDDHRPQSHILPPTNSQTGNRDTQQRLRGRRVEDFSRSGSSYRWPRIEDNPAPAVLGNEINSLEPPPMSSSGATPFGLDDDEFAQEDTHYSQTVSAILQHQFSRYSETLPNMAAFLTYSAHSAFCKWSPSSHDHLRSSSQWTLKYILFTVPFLHSKSGHDQETASSMFKSREITTDSVSGRLRKGGTPQEELSANHVLAERRRREKLNERFIVLRSLVPFVTKMDKASILGDTIEYVKQLRKKIQELEARTREMEADHGQSRIVGDAMKKSSSVKEQRNKMARGVDRRKMRILKGSGGGGGGKQGMVEEGIVTKLEVSIIESDGLVQLQCPHREGLLLDMMQVLRELRVEITAIQSSLNNGIFVAELKAKVKEDNNNKGKKATIMEVKRAIQPNNPSLAACC